MSRGSRIVNVTSVSGRVPTPGEAFYSACKAAVVSLSEALEAELAGRGIGVTVVLPGEMSTALFAEHPSWERRPAFQRRMEIPPERVAEAIVRAVRLVSEVGRPPGGSVPPGPFPKVFPRLHREPHVAAAGATFAARSRTRRRRGPSPRTRPRRGPSG